MVTAAELIRAHGLEKHSHGGYFKPTFISSRPEKVSMPAGPRALASTILFLLSQDSPIGYFNCNKCDVLHFYHSGAAAKYHLFDPATKNTSEVVLGRNNADGEVLSFLSPAGTYKAVEIILREGEDHVLLSEAVIPAFHPDDFRFVDREDLLRDFPEKDSVIKKFTMEGTKQ